MGLSKIQAESMNLADTYVFTGDVTSSVGINFGVTSATASNLLSDFEEGSWNPVIRDSAGSSLTTVNKGSYYKKVGDMVNLWFYIQRNDSGSFTQTLQISGFPFTSKSSNFASLCGQVWIDNSSSTDRKVFIYLGANETIASVVASGTTSSNTTTNEVDNGRYLYGNLSYLTD